MVDEPLTACSVKLEADEPEPAEPAETERRTPVAPDLRGGAGSVAESDVEVGDAFETVAERVRAGDASVSRRVACAASVSDNCECGMASAASTPATALASASMLIVVSVGGGGGAGPAVSGALCVGEGAPEKEADEVVLVQDGASTAAAVGGGAVPLSAESPRSLSIVTAADGAERGTLQPCSGRGVVGCARIELTVRRSGGSRFGNMKPRKGGLETTYEQTQTRFFSPEPLFADEDHVK